MEFELVIERIEEGYLERFEERVLGFGEVVVVERLYIIAFVPCSGWGDRQGFQGIRRFLQHALLPFLTGGGRALPRFYYWQFYCDIGVLAGWVDSIPTWCIGGDYTLSFVNSPSPLNCAANKVGEGCSGKGKKMYLLVMVNPGILKFERECKVLVAKPSLVLVNHIKEDKWRDVLCSNTSTSQSSPICSLQIIMSGVPESNASFQASRGSKRKWVPEEDEKLVSCMVDLHNVGTFNVDTGFKAGYLNELERMLQTALPNAMLKAKPNIESRIRLLKREWSIVYDMLNGQNNSGFGWDEHRQLVVTEDAVWESYLKVNYDLVLASFGGKLLIFETIWDIVILRDLYRDTHHSFGLPSSLPGLSISFLGYPVQMTFYILNNVPTKAPLKTPYKLWHGKKSNLNHLRIWGCPAHVSDKIKEVLKELSGNKQNPTKIVPDINPNSKSANDQQYRVLHPCGRVSCRLKFFFGRSVLKTEFAEYEDNDRLTYNEVMQSDDSKIWEITMKVEMDSMDSN
ncbi:hypothetical protein GOBAR_DD03586 [Gossypium barbadense]|nr:hypothetical protein GOBAR_DD03586 [Gossypium barbadense]